MSGRIDVRRGRYNPVGQLEWRVAWSVSPAHWDPAWDELDGHFAPLAARGLAGVWFGVGNRERDWAIKEATRLLDDALCRPEEFEDAVAEIEVLDSDNEEEDNG